MRMKQLILFVGLLGVILTSCNKPNYNVSVKSENDSIAYLIGVYYGKQLKSGGELESLNVDAMAKGLKEAFNNDSLKITDEEIQVKLNMYFTKLQKLAAEKNLKAGKDFLEANKKKAGIIVLPSGLQYQVIKEGTGPQPDSSNMVTVHYTGYHIDGTEFESSTKGEPVQFKVTQVIPGWTEALLKMKVGSKWKLFIPTEIGYGERVGRGSKVKQNEALVFEVELLKVEKEQPADQQGMPQGMR